MTSQLTKSVARGLRVGIALNVKRVTEEEGNLGVVGVRNKPGQRGFGWRCLGGGESESEGIVVDLLASTSRDIKHIRNCPSMLGY